MEAPPPPEWRHPPPRTPRRERSRARPVQVPQPVQPPPPPRTSRRERSQPRHSAPTPPSESPRRENLQASPVPSSSARSAFEDEHEEHEAEVEEEAEAEEQPLGENAIKRLIQEEVAKVSSAQAEEVPSFGDTVASESQAHQAILEQLRPFYPQIKRVQNSATQKVSYEYAFSFSDPDGFWSVPEPALYHPIANKLDTYGYFGVLFTPTINRYWSFTTKPLMSEAEEEDSQAQAVRPVARSFDS